MSNVKEGIQIAIENVKSAAGNTYGAKVYTFDQVAMILQDIYETAKETDENGMAVLTSEQIGQLIEMIEERIDSNINDMTDSDIVDSDSIEMSISGGRASVDNIDVDKDQIISEAQYGIDDEIYKWADRMGIHQPD